MSSCERTEKRSEGDPISSNLLPLIGRGGVIGLVLEHVIRFCSLLVSFTVLCYVVVHHW